MATFTKIDDGEQPVITVNSAHKISKIEDNTHMGRCIYGGIYDPGSPLSDENGYRKDVIAAFQELKCPVVRYPGGNFIATYHWQDGVGPREKRPKRQELAWHGIETNEFGTDEFLKWCEIVGTEPYLALNFGTGTLEEALGWLEYCNSDCDSYYANLRRQNGREKPYGAYQWAKALKLLDPSVELILCGKDGPTHWDYYVTKECINYIQHALGNNDSSCLIDMHSIHIYTASDDHYKNATAPRQAERAIEITSSLIDLARIENGVPTKIKKQKICFDEWNVWDPIRAPGWLGAEEKYTLSDALAVANWLNVLVRQSKHIGMATIAQSSTWWPLLLFSKYMRGHTIAAHVQSGDAAVDDAGTTSLVVVNIHQEIDFRTKVEGIPAGSPVDVYTVTGPSIQSTNTNGAQEVGIAESQWTAEQFYVFPKLSMTMLRWKA
ncbi:unnamed protein product [Parascedosporium putredinis]|uniref:non-reducing end alpha-L-arabinofuranosidase n=1 Tax=Parascedosporium putredinis TaxID=1442378 RepID=A0A9P1MA35_9PEZI|nr:unnamed protein product [Parascedosporium putredinis]CAI7995905.1 unnamed protein product [Parascedosporium putredinis]